MLSFSGFKNLRENQPPEFATKYFNAKIFLSLPKNVEGMITAESLMNHIQKMVDTEKTILQLWFYDRSGKGTITEFDLYNYVGCIMPKILILNNMPSRFHDWYISIAARKFFFFLDSKRKCTFISVICLIPILVSVSILRLATSAVMSEFLALKRQVYPNDPYADNSKLIMTEIASNWFSYESASSVYSHFVDLDRDDDGFLTASDLKRFCKIPFVIH